MKNRYNGKEAEVFVKTYPDSPPELSMRVYTSRLIGQEDDLVLHGGGNTSVKGKVVNLLGEEMEVLYIKGSGWDLGSIEPAGFPALDLSYLRKLRKLERLTDEEMVNQFRTHLLDATAPNPSIETLVHAFLPHKFIDHTHADAIVTLTNQEQAEALLREALGEKIAILPFIMPGFPLAKAMAELYEQQPDIDCLILMNHGIFTFADDAETAYGRMIHYVDKAEKFIDQAVARQTKGGIVSVPAPDPGIVLPIIRGATAVVDDTGRKQVFSLCLRQSEEISAGLARADAQELFVTGVLTPDHVIRTKNYPLWLDFTGCEDESSAISLCSKAVKEYQERYDRYFQTQVEARSAQCIKLDSMPRVMLVPGLGIVTVGTTPKAAKIAADIAEHTLLAKIRGSALGCYKALDERSIFDMEYWSLEQAKLGKGGTLPLAGKAALVTGGGGAIAMGIGRKLLEAGARVFLSDIDEERLEKVCEKLGKIYGREMAVPLIMDVADGNSVAGGVGKMIKLCGGLDILVPNAGIAHVAPLEELDEKKFQQVLAVNCVGVFQVIKASAPVFRRQGTGGNIVINSSKNVFDPGASFGAYSASKAGAHQLGKIAALELARYGVRVNMINADAIFDDEGVTSGLWDVVGPDRMRSRRLDPEGLKDYYRQRNLLKTEVHADHVGNAVVFFATEQTPTTGATLPIDGGIPAAFPR